MPCICPSHLTFLRDSQCETQRDCKFQFFWGKLLIRCGDHLPLIERILLYAYNIYILLFSTFFFTVSKI